MYSPRLSLRLNAYASRALFVGRFGQSTTTSSNNYVLNSARTMATKKAAGSTANGRDSPGKHLGIKVWPGIFAKAGNIIVRQRGQKFRPGENVGMGRDFTLFAKAPGIVKMTRYEKNKKRNVVHVIPVETSSLLTHAE